MAKNNKSDSIEINGKRYDATTGAELSETVTMKPHHHLDGVVAPAGTVYAPTKHVLHKQPKPSRTTGKPSHHAPSMRDVMRPIAKHHGPAHSPQPAQTLMRRAVTKPTVTPKTQFKAQGQASQLVSQTVLEVAPKLSATIVDNRRLKHAQVIPKSRLISRYNMDVVIARTPAIPARSGSVGQAATTLPRASHQPAPSRPQTTADLLQRAIEQATSHRQVTPHIKRSAARNKRIVSVSTLALVSLVLFGFVLHQNMPNIKLDMASSKAGFAAGLPTNQPAGYSLGTLSASTGQVALQFHSNSDNNRVYNLVEKPSDWDSVTLRDMFVTNASANRYQTVQTAGRTLYLYGQQNITWVNGGIWYLVRSDGVLSNQQLIDLATSL